MDLKADRLKGMGKYVPMWIHLQLKRLLDLKTALKSSSSSPTPTFHKWGNDGWGI